MYPSMTDKRDLIKFSHLNNRDKASGSAQRQVGATPVQQRGGAVVTDLDVLHTADHDLVITTRQPFSTAHSSPARTPCSRGLPVGPGRCRTPSQAAARPRRAKLAERCCWGAASTLTTNAPCERTARRVRLARSKQTSTSGGSSDSDVTALAVVPTGSPSSHIDVTTVTPVAKWLIACRNSEALTSRTPRGRRVDHRAISSRRLVSVTRVDHQNPVTTTHLPGGEAEHAPERSGPFMTGRTNAMTSVFGAASTEVAA